MAVMNNPPIGRLVMYIAGARKLRPAMNILGGSRPYATLQCDEVKYTTRVTPNKSRCGCQWDETFSCEIMRDTTKLSLGVHGGRALFSKGTIGETMIPLADIINSSSSGQLQGTKEVWYPIAKRARARGEVQLKLIFIPY